MKEIILFIYPQKSSFINSDIEFLSKKYNVKTQDLLWNKASILPLNLITQFFFLIRNIQSSKVIVISFAGYFSLLPVLFGKLLRKKTLLILNGTDCVLFPEYNYGSLRKPLLLFFVKKSQQYATKLLPVDASLIEQVHTFDETIFIKNQGFKAHFPKLKTPIKVIPNGFDTDFWTYNTQFIKRKEFITVVSASKKSTAIFKGIDLIVNVAKQFPNKIFTIVGLSEEVQQEFKVGKNVIFYSFVKKEVLKQFYQEHQFYLQLSVNEGFGCALSEAMLCGCIPIVSNAGALPNVIGKTGFIIEKRGVDIVKKMIEKILFLTEEERIEKGIKARFQIENNFSISNREKLLLQEIES
ncbi:glycosyltransferase involved in cell wall biosynthesis [Tenacibaculum adriaticum]|uniref:Glycosyltransferase involved in cell wall biosynthesis n=1 Tax=Tenacibaculum adriaticum TaxID=413713 RepID=A0A5S5DLA8_9FLAO|nr:glycosyltransferase family 4 protein [Tenacibaculum adriaticum]TYP96495.1 glycosyltransferase involved in cell wall biosynthesis [Tenacibaculum adriaticum]